MELPAHPQPIEVHSNDRTISVGVTEEGQPTGVQLTQEALRLSGSELARRIMRLYSLAKTAALAVLNIEHNRETGTWVPSWPSQAHVDLLERQIDF